jgi:hypothetical protein
VQRSMKNQTSALPRSGATLRYSGDDLSAGSQEKPGRAQMGDVISDLRVEPRNPQYEVDELKARLHGAS